MAVTVIIYNPVPLFAGLCFGVAPTEAVLGLCVGIFVSTGFSLTVVHPELLRIEYMKLLSGALVMNLLRALSIRSDSLFRYGCLGDLVSDLTGTSLRVRGPEY
jgi:hypothetical protein